MAEIESAATGALAAEEVAPQTSHVDASTKLATCEGEGKIAADHPSAPADAKSEAEHDKPAHSGDVVAEPPTEGSKSAEDDEVKFKADPVGTSELTSEATSTSEGGVEPEGKLGEGEHAKASESESPAEPTEDASAPSAQESAASPKSDCNLMECSPKTGCASAESPVEKQLEELHVESEETKTSPASKKSCSPF